MKTSSFAAIVAGLAGLTNALPGSTSPLAKRFGRWEGNGGGSSCGQCPGTLTGTVLSPDLIVPVSAENPDTAYGPKPFAQFTPNDLSTILNFDIPEEATNKTCTLYFSFPSYQQLCAPEYYFEGPGNFNFSDYIYAPGPDVTFNTQPPIFLNIGVINLQPGNFYTLSSIPCHTGNISGITSTADTTLYYLQEQNLGACPLGLFVTYE